MTSREEVNILTNILQLFALKYMNKYPSIDFKRILVSIREVIDEFKFKLRDLDNQFCLNAELLKKHGLLKEKYYIYGAFLAAISSYPILYMVADEKTIKSAILSKVAMVTSSKVLDNINDNLHNFQEAVKSQQKYQQALTRGYFYPDLGKNLKLVDKAENTTYVMACWVHQLMTLKGGVFDTFNMFVNDVNECIEGQIHSFYQRHEKYTPKIMNLSTFLRKTSTKSFGKIWVDIDFCFFEKSVGKLSKKEFKAIKLINQSIDLLFRALLFYDDVADLEEDIKSNLINSVIMLGLELEKISYEDLVENNFTLIRKIEEANLSRDTINFGDILYLKGIDCLRKAKKYSHYIDIEALIFCARVLRMFLLRKFVLRKKSLKSLNVLFQSLNRFERLEVSIPSYLKECYRLVLEEPVIQPKILA